MRNRAIGYGFGFGACLAFATILIVSGFGGAPWAAAGFCLAAFAVLAGFWLDARKAAKRRA